MRPVIISTSFTAHDSHNTKTLGDISALLKVRNLHTSHAVKYKRLATNPSALIQQIATFLELERYRDTDITESTVIQKVVDEPPNWFWKPINKSTGIGRRMLNGSGRSTCHEDVSLSCRIGAILRTRDGV